MERDLKVEFKEVSKDDVYSFMDEWRNVIDLYEIDKYKDKEVPIIE